MRTSKHPGTKALAYIGRASESYLGRFLLSIAILVLVVFLVDRHELGDFPSWFLDGDGGDSLPAWIEAGATVGAFIAAFVAVRHSWALLEIERASRLNAEQAAERAVQADGVAAWTTESRKSFVRNSSELPIYEVALAWVDGTDQRGVELGTLPPKTEVDVPFPLTAGIQDEDSGAVTHYEDPRRYKVLLRFRDAGGRIWQRDQYGVLSPPTRMVFASPSDARPLSVSQIVADWREIAEPGPS